MRVDAVMARSVITVAPDMLLDQAANLLVKHKVGGLPLMDGGKLVGVILAIENYVPATRFPHKLSVRRLLKYYVSE